jgi:undecaprenyl phosphate N,N'-diacetylbacillosamine 1-phosphate transferase
MYKRIVKPASDFIIALTVFIVLLPFTILSIIFLSIANKGKVFFIQKRPGKNEKIFYIVKFKTMNDKKDKNGNLLPDSQRLTTVGKIIRRFSIDEIPQLINVIKGDMSLIGPRPLLPEYLPLYNAVQKQRHNVKPGITGLAQVNGRNAISWIKKFEYDVWYVNNVSFFLDLRIFILTIKKVIKKEGINSYTSSTVERFNGIN